MNVQRKMQQIIILHFTLWTVLSKMMRRAIHLLPCPVNQVILQSDNAKNLSGKDMKMFVNHTVSTTEIDGCIPPK